MNVEALRLIGDGDSADIIRDVFQMYMPDGGSVLDLTWGTGTFWKWDWRAAGICLTANDLYADAPGPGEVDAFTRMDFTALPDHAEWHRADAVVFDPPFTANGKQNRGGRHQDRYGATRDLPGAPQNIRDVHRLLGLGIREACAVARRLVIVKTMDVVESGRYHDSEGVARDALRAAGFRIKDIIRFLGARRDQPDVARGCAVRTFRNRPSVFLIAAPVRRRL